jgi:HSP20 family protein
MSQTAELQKTQSNHVQTASRSDVSLVVLRPRIDLLESADAWMLRAEMPGVDEKHAEVSVEQHILTIAGTAEFCEPEGFDRQYGEFRARRYERSFRLPEEVDRSQIEASMRHGVLTVRIPKAPEAQPTKIVVRGA